LKNRDINKTKQANHTTMSVEHLTTKLQYARKQKAYAWAKYYEQVHSALHGDHGNVAMFEPQCFSVLVF